MAAWIASEKIIVGVTDDKLLAKKKFKEVLEDNHVRRSKVTAFLSLFRPGLVYNVVSIDDVYGPTGTDEDIQALVVTHEPSTVQGANAIDSHRVEKGWNKLDRFTIDVISFTESKIELVSDNEDSDKAKENLLKKMEDKMSSTYIRGWIVKNQGTGN